jgi:hypothetical protein
MGLTVRDAITKKFMRFIHTHPPMLRPPRTSTNKALIVSASLVHFWSVAAAQNITLQLTNVDPLGVADFIPGEGTIDVGQTLGMENGIKGDLSYGLNVNSTYDSNFSMSADDPDSELYTYLTPSFNYRSDPEGGARFSLTGNYAPSMRFYLQNSGLNDLDHNGELTFTALGSKTTLSAYLRYEELAGGDRLAEEFVQGSIINVGVDGSYQIASRTSLVASASAAISDYQSSDLVGAEVYRGQVGGLWDATGRLSLGPSLRYTLTQSDNTGDQDAWALLLNGRYRAGEKIQLFSSIGVEHTKSSRDGFDPSLGFTGSFVGAYAITPRLAWSNSIIYGTVPSASVSNFLVRNLALTTSLNRTLTWGWLEAGVAVNFSDYEETGEVTSNPEMERNFSPYIGYQRMLFSERVAFQTQLRYTINRGEVDWSQLQLSAGLQVQF